MLDISHDFMQNTLAVYGAEERSYRTSWCWCASLQNLVFPRCSFSRTWRHTAVPTGARACRDECLHMCSEPNAALWLVLSWVWCGKLHTLRSAVQKCSSTQTQQMGLTTVRGRRVLWWPWIFLCGFCDNAPPNGGGENYTSWSTPSQLQKNEEKSRRLRENEREMHAARIKGGEISHQHNLSQLSPPTLFLLSIFLYFLLHFTLFPSVLTAISEILPAIFLPETFSLFFHRVENESKLAVGSN